MSRALTVWSSAPESGTAQHASRRRAPFQARVATRSPGRTPTAWRAAASRTTRPPHCPHVVRRIDRSGLHDTTSTAEKYVVTRSSRCRVARVVHHEPVPRSLRPSGVTHREDAKGWQVSAQGAERTPLSDSSGDSAHWPRGAPRAKPPRGCRSRSARWTSRAQVPPLQSPPKIVKARESLTQRVAVEAEHGSRVAYAARWRAAERNRPRTDGWPR